MNISLKAMNEEWIKDSTTAQELASAMERAEQTTTTINALVDAFLAWEWPENVCVNGCAASPWYPCCSGTCLLFRAEAQEMFEHILSVIPLQRVVPNSDFDYMFETGWEKMATVYNNPKDASSHIAELEKSYSKMNEINSEIKTRITELETKLSQLSSLFDAEKEYSLVSKLPKGHYERLKAAFCKRMPWFKKDKT